MAGDSGSINLWRDDNGNLRGDRCFHTREMELKTFKNLTLASKWYQKALKKIQ